MESLRIQLCMGSSCFSRGNGRSLRILQAYVQENDLDVKIDLRGSLCTDSCDTGPHLSIGSKCYSQVDASTVLDLLKHHIEAGV